MNAKDLQQLHRWLSTRATLDEVQRAPRFGLVDNERFTEQARRAYVLLWNWSAPRFSGGIGARQDALHAKHGALWLKRRHERARRIARSLGAPE